MGAGAQYYPVKRCVRRKKAEGLLSYIEVKNISEHNLQWNHWYSTSRISGFDGTQPETLKSSSLLYTFNVECLLIFNLSIKCLFEVALEILLIINESIIFNYYIFWPNMWCCVFIIFLFIHFDLISIINKENLSNIDNLKRKTKTQST